MQKTKSNMNTANTKSKTAFCQFTVVDIRKRREKVKERELV